MKILACLASFCCASALAASNTTDFTDLWYNPNEEGWGANVIHQRDTLFITLFVYGPNSQPTWYVASDVDLTSTANGVLSYSGALYQTSGPYFRDPFNENAVQLVPVGTIAFTSAQLDSATLTYVVGGATVTKTLTRQTWAAETLTGQFAGASFSDWTNCPGRAAHTEAFAGLTIAHSATNAVTIFEAGQPGYSCTYNGTYTQAGRLGRITGTGTCSDGFNPAFTMSEVEVGANGLTMRIDAEHNGCRMTGRMGGVRK